MLKDHIVERAGPKTPKAAAVAGIVFSALLIAIFWLLRTAIPADPLEAGAWLAGQFGTVALALNLVPFAGISFLWFIGVLRDRLGAREDRFFATVFLGSGLLFLAMLFAAAAVIGAILLVFAADPNEMLNSATFKFARALAYNLMNVYAIKMAGVFMISTSTVAIYTDHGAALDRHPRIRAGAGSAARQLLPELELRGDAAVGAAGQHPHPDRQFPRTGRRSNSGRETIPDARRTESTQRWFDGPAAPPRHAETLPVLLPRLARSFRRAANARSPRSRCCR